MPKIIYDLSHLRDQYKVHAEEPQLPMVVELPEGFIGNTVVVKDTDQNLFVSSFEDKDVETFSEFFKRSRPALSQMVFLGRLGREILSTIRGWQASNAGRCPYEPFLWALKINDGFVGSIKFNIVPQPPILNQFGEALAEIWDQDNPMYAKVIRNILIRWNWYQPIHAVLSLLAQLPCDALSPEIDEVIREKTLYTRLYAVSAFYCLIKRPKTRENICALINFILAEKQSDKTTGADIPITKDMRQKLRDYIERDRVVLETAQQHYESIVGKTSMCRKAREMFDEIFYPGDKGTGIEKIIADYCRAKNSAEKQEALSRFRIEYTGAKEQNYVLSALRDPDLLWEAIQIIDVSAFSWSRQFHLLSLANNSHTAARDYINKKYREICEAGQQREEWFVYGCGSCLAGNTSLLPELCRAFFCDSIGTDSGAYIFAAVRQQYPAAFKDQIHQICDECIDHPDKRMSILKSCFSLYRRTRFNETAYLVTLDRIWIRTVDEALASTPCAATPIELVLGLMEIIVTPGNRQRYYATLMKVSNTTSPELENARKRAIKLLRKIWND